MLFGLSNTTPIIYLSVTLASCTTYLGTRYAKVISLINTYPKEPCLKPKPQT